MTRSIATVGVALWLAGCGTTPAPAADGGAAELDGSTAASDSGELDAGGLDSGVADAGDPLTVTLLDAGAFAATDAGGGWPYQLLKLHRPSSGPTYAQFFPSVITDAGPSPVLMLTLPYDGIGWSDDPEDAKWAARAAGMYDDSDQPDWRPDAGMSQISWGGLTTPDEVAGNALVYGFNGLSVLAVYGRWYRGGSAESDVQDMVNGLLFLQQRDDVDHARVGISGASWGGFEAIHGALNAPPGARPTVGAATFPASDLEDLMLYLRYGLSRFSPTLASSYATFFEPHTRRIRASTGGWPGEPGADYTRYNAAALISRLEMPFFVSHEDWDTLVPFQQSVRIKSGRPDTVENAWFLHANEPANWDDAPVGHGQLIAAGGLSVESTFRNVFLLLRLVEPTRPIRVYGNTPPFRTYLNGVRARQLEGKELRWAARRLAEVADPRVRVQELSTNTNLAGAQWVATQVNAVWGTSYTAANVRAALQTGLPP